MPANKTSSRNPRPTPRCDYCGKLAQLVSGDVIYPHRRDLRHKHFWQCAPCKAYVGTHANSADHVPLGRLADADLRKAKNAAHAAFDPLWKGGSMSRKAAYAWLADKMKIPNEKCHIGMFDVSQCRLVVHFCFGLDHDERNRK